MASRLKVYFDGGCRPNPGQMELAVVAAGQSYIVPDLGPGTSEDAEWLALISALRTVRSLGRTDFVLLGDAVSVIGPAMGTARCRGQAIRHLREYQALVGSAPPPLVRYVKRTQNLAGIALAQLHPR